MSFVKIKKYNITRKHLKEEISTEDWRETLCLCSDTKDEWTVWLNKYDDNVPAICFEFEEAHGTLIHVWVKMQLVSISKQSITI